MHTDDKAIIYENLNKGIPAETKLPFLSLVASLIIILVLVVPEYKTVKMAEMRVELMEKNLKSKEDVVKKIMNYNEVNKGLNDEDIKKFSKLLPEEDNIEEYVANVGNLATISRIFVSDFSVGKSNKPIEIATGNRTLKLNTVEINLSLGGSFTDLMLFLNYLEKSVPLMNLNELEIKKKEEKGTKIRVSYGGNRKDFYAVSNTKMESMIFHFDNLKDSERNTQLAGVSSDLINWSLNVDDGYLDGDVAYNFYANGLYEEGSFRSVNNIYIPSNNENDENKNWQLEEKVWVEANVGFSFYYL